MKIACYINSLLQSYYQIPQLFKLIQEYKLPYSKEQYQQLPPKQKLSTNMLLYLRNLFVEMTLSAQKYVNANNVINNLVDDYGNTIQVGEQNDVCELHLQFISRLEEVYNQQHYQNNPDQSSINPNIANANINQQQVFRKSNSYISSAKKNENINQSLIKLSTILQDRTNFSEFSNLFFGKLVPHLSYPLNNQIHQKVENPINFGPIILDISSQNLENALDQFLHYKIEDYQVEVQQKQQDEQQYRINDQQNNQIQVVEAQQDLWIKEAPQILFFQLQRTIYQPDKGIIKDCSEFHFEKEIELGKLMIHNKDCYQQQKAKDHQIQLEIVEAQKMIQEIDNYKGTGQSMICHLEKTKQIMADPIFSTFDNNSQKSNYEALKVIDNKIQQIQQFRNQKQSLIKKLKQKKTETSGLSSQGRSKKYYLSSILMHDGLQSQEGHFYSYVYDQFRKEWNMFSDITVKTCLDEQEVLEEAYGIKERTKQAYCLVYLSEQMVHNGHQKSLLETYKNMIQMDRQNSMLKSNQQFYQVVLEKKQQVLSSKIVNYYICNFTNTKEQYDLQSKQINKSQKMLNNYLQYLYQKYNDGQSSIFKLKLLDISIKQASQELEFDKLLKKVNSDQQKLDLKSLCHFSNLQNNIKQILVQLEPLLQMKQFDISNEIIHILQNDYQQYLQFCESYYKCIQLIKKANNCQLKSMFSNAYKLIFKLDPNNYQNNYQEKLLFEIQMIGFLHKSKQLNNMINQSDNINFDKFIEILNEIQENKNKLANICQKFQKVQVVLNTTSQIMQKMVNSIQHRIQKNPNNRTLQKVADNLIDFINGKFYPQLDIFSSTNDFDDDTQNCQMEQQVSKMMQQIVQNHSIGNGYQNAIEIKEVEFNRLLQDQMNVFIKKYKSEILLYYQVVNNQKQQIQQPNNHQQNTVQKQNQNQQHQQYQNQQYQNQNYNQPPNSNNQQYPNNNNQQYPNNNIQYQNYTQWNQGSNNQQSRNQMQQAHETQSSKNKEEEQYPQLSEQKGTRNTN